MSIDYYRSWHEQRLRDILAQVSDPNQWLEDNSLYIYEALGYVPKVRLYILSFQSVKQDTTMKDFFFVVFHKTMKNTYAYVSQKYRDLIECTNTGCFLSKNYALFGRLNRIKL
ncbi:MAG: hypothetical protein K5762_06300 [Bacilli bacterium]|nr:hypothetical protein [Bacilli bacterium]